MHHVPDAPDLFFFFWVSQPRGLGPMTMREPVHARKEARTRGKRGISRVRNLDNQMRTDTPCH